MENSAFWWYLPGKIGIFHGDLLVYRRVLPLNMWHSNHPWPWFKSAAQSLEPKPGAKNQQDAVLQRCLQHWCWEQTNPFHSTHIKAQRQQNNVEMKMYGRLLGLLWSDLSMYHTLMFMFYLGLVIERLKDSNESHFDVCLGLDFSGMIRRTRLDRLTSWESEEAGKIEGQFVYPNFWMGDICIYI